MSVLKENKFAHEEVPSDAGHVSGYTKPKSLVNQMIILKNLFPKELGTSTYDEVIANKPIPNGMEGYFLIPKWQLFGRTYSEACNKGLTMFAKVCNGGFYTRIHIGVNYLRESQKKNISFSKIAEVQKGHNILVVAGQFGTHYRGKLPDHVLGIMSDNELGLGVFEIAIMLVTHKNRFKYHYSDHNPQICCVGDEYFTLSNTLVRYPCFKWFGMNVLELISCKRLYSPERFGFASIFVP